MITVPLCAYADLLQRSADDAVPSGEAVQDKLRPFLRRYPAARYQGGVEPARRIRYGCLQGSPSGVR